MVEYIVGWKRRAIQETEREQSDEWFKLLQGPLLCTKSSPGNIQN